MLSINRYSHGDSYIHQCHPLIKFLGFLVIFFLMFLNISVFTQFCLLIITLWIAFKCKCFGFLFDKTAYLYVCLLFFLLTVNWLFNKNPGFWSLNNLDINYKEIFGNPFTTSSTKYSSAGNSSAEQDIIFNGWYYGGKLVTNNSSGGYAAYAENADCIRKLAGYTTNISRCTDNSVAASTSEYVDYSARNLKIFSTLNQSGNRVYVGFYSKWYSITAMQFVHAWNMTNKLVMVIILTSILSMTTSMSNIAYALEDFFKPLKIFRLPVEELSLIVAIAVRFAPSLLEESFRIIRAQASRGIDFKNGRIRDKCMSILSLFIPLFVIAFIKSDELSSALIVRGYQPKKIRSSSKNHKLVCTDYVPFAMLTIFLGTLYAITFNHGYCQVFGQVEYLLLLAK